MPTLDITPVRSFVAVAAFCGIRRAAETLHVSPATVTGHIRRLEHELGCALVRRDGRGIALTADGEELAARGRSLLEAHDDAVRALLPPHEGELVLAATEYAVESVIPAIVETLRINMPHTPIRFRFTRSAWVRELVQDSRADIGLMLERPMPGHVEVGRIPLNWVGHRDAPRTKLVAYSNPCAVRNIALPALGPEGDVIRECRDLTTLLSAVRRGDGVAALPRIGALPDGVIALSSMPQLPAVRLYATRSERVEPRVWHAVITKVRNALA